MGWMAGKDAGILAGWLGYDEDPSQFQGYGPSGVATLIPAVDDGFTVTLSWVTDIIGHRDGTEQRIATLLRPKQTYKGAAAMEMNETRLQRSRLARYATQGATFLLALPHEQILLAADASGTTLTVSAGELARCDWAQIGQRVTVLSADRSQSIDGVVQNSTSTTLVLDVAPGTIGKAGGWLMPLMAIYLDPQQDFARYRVNVETWNINARAAIFDFAPVRATLDVATATGDSALAHAVFAARQDGLAGNAREVTLADGAGTGAGSIVESTDGTTWLSTFTLKGGTSTLDDLLALTKTSLNVLLIGTWTPGQVISSADIAAFGAFRPLTGGLASGAMGVGATLTMYDSHPVWDRGVQNDSTISDPSLALTEIVDLGGVPVSLGHADDPVWGRAVAITSDGWEDWAWLKLFLATVRGRQKMFWLPTDRADFTFVSATSSTLTVRTDDDSDIEAWWPAQRDRLQLRHTDGTVEYARIVSRVDNGNGTQTLTVQNPPGIANTAIAQISWLEAVRFDTDDFAITFDSSGYSMAVTARAHTPSTAELAEDDS